MYYETYGHVHSIVLIHGKGSTLQISFGRLFYDLGDSTKVTTKFDAEGQNSLEMQKESWQSIMNNLKKVCGILFLK